MTQRGCTREGDVHEASATGRWTPELRSHLIGCAPCRDVALVTTTLATPASGAPTPIDPVVLWERARRARRLDTEARISRVVTGTQIAAGVVVLAAVASFARWPSSWPQIALDAGDPVLLCGATGLLLLAALGVTGWARER
jgi:hypothetical protein